MPELPELQNYADNLNRRLSGKTIKSVQLFPKAKLNVSSETLAKELEQIKICAVQRDGRELVFLFDTGDRLAVHLMQNGETQLITDSEQLAEVVGKVMAWEFAVENESANGRQESCGTLVFSDFQKQLKICLNPEPAAAPDALSEEFTWDYFVSRVKDRARRNIKAFLLDEEVVRGIGNAYADEILYESGISPKSVAGYIPETELEYLHQAIPSVLTEAAFKIRKLKPDVINGDEKSILKIHNDDLIMTEKGEPILVKQIASRKTYYTESQELFQ